MDLGLQGKVAMVAAGTKGIGLACAFALQAEGCRVSVCGRNEGSLGAARKGGLHACCADVTKEPDLARWFNEVSQGLGSPTILVTNTGGPPAGSWQEMSDEQWQSGVDSTLLNVVRMMRIAVPGMKVAGWGRVVHITSLVAKQPALLLPISSTLRAGLMALTRLQATELAPHGITVNGVLPGHTLTDRQTHLAEIRAEKAGISVDEALHNQAQEIPVKRLAGPEEIAHAVAFLCSTKAAYITGVNLLVDGGLTNGIA